jgi:hypothetical protein
VQFNPGEIIATCSYCGFTTVIETGKAFTFEHSLVPNKFDSHTIDVPIRDWMGGGFLKPKDLVRRSKISEKNLFYLPFWVVSVEAKSVYKGIFERIAPAVMNEGTLTKEYDWLILAREASVFPTREYRVPLAGKIPFDFRRIEGYAKLLNSEIGREAALELAKTQIDVHHRYLLRVELDRIVEMQTDLNLKQMVYLHAPFWFVKYVYKDSAFQIIIDGAMGVALKGDLPPVKFGLF